ncbi:MAG: HlyC/CorC family transporter [Kistimonas sp.]|nr:HlyC/CorC family transporter [Kistimonas sp.]
MNEAPSSLLLGVLIFLLFLSAFFSGSETGMMSLNPYRLRHMARKGHKGALRTRKLLERPDRLIGVILIGNNFVNNLSAAITTLLAIRLWGDGHIALASFLLTLVVLIFSEVMPKTLAAQHPESLAFPASLILKPLLWLLYPLVVTANSLSNGLLRLLRMQPQARSNDQLSREELRTLVREAGNLIPNSHKGMLVNILDLEKVTVDDIMVPRHEIIGIDTEEGTGTIRHQLGQIQHTRVPIYRKDINNILGLLHTRDLTRLLLDDRNPDTEKLVEEAAEPYFVPEGTALHTQMINFQRQKLRSAFVVNEYGEVQGLVTLEDILEEIVGDFTTDMDDSTHSIQPQSDGSVIIEGATSLREINRHLGWKLPAEGPRTLSGLITELLEDIPGPGLCLSTGCYRMEVLQVHNNRAQAVKVWTI